MSHLAEGPGTQEVLNKCSCPFVALEGGSQTRSLCAWHLVGLDECVWWER